MFSRQIYLEWSKDAISQFSKHIVHFKDIMKAPFSKPQASTIGTSDYHDLDHLVHILRGVGGTQYHYRYLFNHGRMCLKEYYFLNSKRPLIVIPELVRRQELRLGIEPYSS